MPLSVKTKEHFRRRMALAGPKWGALMGGAMISETIFNVHGIGYLTYQSILKGECNLVVSIVTLLMLIFVVCNLLVDMLYAALDPRIRYA